MMGESDKNGVFNFIFTPFPHPPSFYIGFFADEKEPIQLGVFFKSELYILASQTSLLQEPWKFILILFCLYISSATDGRWRNAIKRFKI